MVRVLLADDHGVVRSGLRMLLERRAAAPIMPVVTVSGILKTM